MSRQFGHEWNIDPPIGLVPSTAQHSLPDWIYSASSFLLVVPLPLFPIPVAVKMAARDKCGPCKFDLLFPKVCLFCLRQLSSPWTTNQTRHACLNVGTNWKELKDTWKNPEKSVFHVEIVDEGKLWQAAKEGNVERVRCMSSFVDVNCVRVRWQLKVASAHPKRAIRGPQKKMIKLLLLEARERGRTEQDQRNPLLSCRSAPKVFAVTAANRRMACHSVSQSGSPLETGREAHSRNVLCMPLRCGQYTATR